MTTEYDFKKQLKLGKLGEEKVFSYLRGLPDTINVIDLSNRKNYQGAGIDGLLIEESAGIWHPTFFDIKTDFQYHRNGKLFIEISTDSENEGGILSTKASVFYYYDPYGGKLFTLPIHAARNWYQREGISIIHRTVKNKAGYETVGISVKPEDLMYGCQMTVTNIGALNPIKYEGL